MTHSKPNDSWYAATAHPRPQHSVLQGDHRADVCILGAGATGLNTAIELAQKGFKVAVLESQKVGWGASGRSGGQIIFGYGCDQRVLEKQLGATAARELWQYSLEGVELVRERINRFGIDCDYVPGHAHVALKQRQVRELQHWQSELTQTQGYSSLTFWDRHQVQQEVVSPRYRAGLYDSNSGHLHPLNYCLGLARAAESLGVTIFENSPVISVQDGAQVTLRTAEGQVNASCAVLAGNAYLRRLMPALEAKLMPVGTYIGATEPLGEARCRSLIPHNVAVADMNLALDYFRRSSDHRLLFGGLVAYSGRQPHNLERTLQRRLSHVFPQLAGTALQFTWGGNIGITVNRAPHFGRTGRNMYFAQGYSGHGLAAAGLAGRLMAEAIAGSEQRLDLFARINHADFPGGRMLRTPALVLAMSWFRLRDWL